MQAIDTTTQQCTALHLRKYVCEYICMDLHKQNHLTTNKTSDKKVGLEKERGEGERERK